MVIDVRVECGIGGVKEKINIACVLVLVAIVWVDGWNDVGWFGTLFCELYLAEEDPKGIIFVFQLFEADGRCIGFCLEFVLM